MSDTILRSPSASNHSLRLRMRGHRGKAVECALVAFLVAFSAFQVLLVVG